MVHAENHDMIGWLSGRLVGEGHQAPKFHAAGHPKLAESEATGRAIDLAELVDAPLYIVHVSSKGSRRGDRRRAPARTQGLRRDLPAVPAADRGGPRQAGDGRGEVLLQPRAPRRGVPGGALGGIGDGTFDVVSSDHAPYSFDEKGKLAWGPEPPFPKICNGVPGVELRMPLLFSEGVGKARISLQRFVAVCCETPARLFGLYPRKGTIAPGSDADLAIWNPDQVVDIRWADLHDRVGYSPYEGRQIKGSRRPCSGAARWWSGTASRAPGRAAAGSWCGTGRTPPSRSTVLRGRSPWPAGSERWTS